MQRIVEVVLGRAVVMVENEAKHCFSISLIGFVLLHVGVPHEVGQFARNNNRTFLFVAEIEELNVVLVACIKV